MGSTTEGANVRLEPEQPQDSGPLAFWPWLANQGPAGRFDPLVQNRVDQRYQDDRSPAWLFVIFTGVLGVCLTLLLFLTWTPLAATSTNQLTSTRVQPILVPVDEVDTRLLVVQAGGQARYPAEFEFTNHSTPAWDRPPRHEPYREPSFLPQHSAPVTHRPVRTPDLEVRINWQHTGPVEPIHDAPPIVITRHSELAHSHWQSRMPHSTPGWEQASVRRGDSRDSHRPIPYQGLLNVDRGIRRLSSTDEDLGGDDYSDDGSSGFAPGRRSIGDVADQLSAPTSDRPDPRLGNRAEVAAVAELYAPTTAGLLTEHLSAIVVRNLGAEPLARVLLSESLARLQVVTAATPDGQVRDRQLVRAIDELHPDRERRLSVTWQPVHAGRMQHVANVVLEALVSSVTHVDPAPPTETPPPAPLAPTLPASEPEPAPLARAELRLTAESETNEEVTVGQSSPLTIVVQNTGERDLRAVSVRVKLPSGLTHPAGRSFVFNVGELDVGESRRIPLSVTTQRAGLQRIQLTAEDQPASVRATAQTEVAAVAPPPVEVALPAAPEPQVADAEPAPVVEPPAEPTAPKPAKKRRVRPAKPTTVRECFGPDA